MIGAIMSGGVDDLGTEKDPRTRRATYLDLVCKIKAGFFDIPPARLPRRFVGNLVASSKKNSWSISLGHLIQAQERDNRVGRCEVPVRSVSMENPIANPVAHARGFGAPDQEMKAELRTLEQSLKRIQ